MFILLVASKSKVGTMRVVEVNAWVKLSVKEWRLIKHEMIGGIIEAYDTQLFAG